ncbi:cysteine proteinase [Blyttiomyces helicus]|uniref:ubiquitinyl hydrolase 1 n=1 Tax=Blyttiomyces helicus TaxID=388810 RepID=A0A4P9WKM3_9FUNG|nr:cysteine proteinase [Blyttiomyces helicus]|eukprot:RKO91720.1 cysteine proteinase [Blyttiomyces helicus]
METTLTPEDLLLPLADQGTHTWHIKNWSELRAQERTHGSKFSCGGSKWRILLFPNGNKKNDHLSIFLESLDATQPEKAEKWSSPVGFSIVVSNPEDPRIFKHMTAHHRFSQGETDWGFNHFIKLSDLFHPLENDGFTRPLIENDATCVTVYIKIIDDITGVLWRDLTHWDSKKETGFVGLKNQGATGYMNSLLQSLYYTTYFRKATFQIPTETDDPLKSIPLALQRVFYNLQHSETSVGTTELTKSFGWDTLDSFMQHDVQEFNRVLQDNLESKMKGTKAEGAISRLFVGKMKSYIKCINVDYESSRVEDFYDIQLNVKGCKTLEDSFKEYVTVETLEGENKYMAEGHGLQDAKKGVIFHSFPPVIHMQLKRFEYDMMRHAMVKINDRHEFPTEINLDAFLSEDADRSIPQNYRLIGVLVHSGDLHGGHNCAFLKTEKDGKWFKFDDDKVLPVIERDVLEENYGGDYPGTPRPGVKTFKRFTNAYMLVYVRESDIDTILAPMTEGDIPEHLRRRLEEEKIANEQRRRDRDEEHLYLPVKVLSDQDIKTHEGFDLCQFDDTLGPPTQLTTYKVKKTDTFASFKQTVAEKIGIRVENFRLWTMAGRQNKTIRPGDPVPEAEFMKTMQEINATGSKSAGELRLYIEIPDQFGDLKTHPSTPSSHCVIFIKYYDPAVPKMEYLGKMTVRYRGSKIADITPVVLGMKGLPLNTPIKLYEEVKPTRIDELGTEKSFHTAELDDGDIICFQKELTKAEIESLPDPAMAELKAYFEWLYNKVTVTFKNKAHHLEKDAPAPVQIVLSKKMTYDQVCERLAEKISADPLKIRLSHYGQSRAPFKRNPSTQLVEMNAGTSHAYTLFYEVLDITKRLIKIFRWVHQQKVRGPFDLLLLKTAKITDVIDALLEKLPKPEVQITRPIRVYEATPAKIHKVYEREEAISVVQEYSVLFAEEVPAEELAMGATDKVITVFHYSKDPSRPHGVPFKFVVKEGEIFTETKHRLQPRFGMNEKDFAKVRFSVLATLFGKRKPVEDSDILSDLLTQTGDMLAADHIDNSGRNARGAHLEKAVKIFVSPSPSFVRHFVCCSRTLTACFLTPLSTPLLQN